jgi:hypothetical protein
MGVVKALFLAVSVALTAGGCSSTRHVPAGTKSAAQPAAATPQQQPTTTAVASRTGKVASVNQELRFVVLDFSVSSIPAEGRTLSVYRAGAKVAEVKVSGPVVGSNTAADILSGNVQVGDAVQED